MKRFLLPLLLAALPVQAAPTIIEFNGFSVRLVIYTEQADPDMTEADETAERLCQSNSKSAEFQSRDRVSNFKYTAFYICA